MKTTIRRIALSCFALGVAAAGLAIPTPAQAQYGQQRAASQQRVAEGTMQWGADGWCYVVQGGRWVKTSYFRRSPDPRNYPNVFDIYQNGRFLRREGTSAPAGNRAPGRGRQLTAAEIQLQQAVAQGQRLIAQGYGQPARGTGGPQAGIVGGPNGAPVRSTGGLHAGTVGGDYGSGGGIVTTITGGPRTALEIAILTGQTRTPVWLTDGTVIIR